MKSVANELPPLQPGIWVVAGGLGPGGGGGGGGGGGC